MQIACRAVIKRSRTAALSLIADEDGALRADGSRIISAGVGQAIAAQFAEESPGSAEQGAR